MRLDHHVDRAFEAHLLRRSAHGAARRRRRQARAGRLRAPCARTPTQPCSSPSSVTSARSPTRRRRPFHPDHGGESERRSLLHEATGFDENLPPRGALHAPSVARPCARQTHSERLAMFRSKPRRAQLYEEGRTHPLDGLDPDTSSHTTDQLAADVETEARTTDCVDLLRNAVELLEDSLLLGLRNTDPLSRTAMRRPFSRDSRRTSIRRCPGVLDCVARGSRAPVGACRGRRSPGQDFVMPRVPA